MNQNVAMCPCSLKKCIFEKHFVNKKQEKNNENWRRLTDLKIQLGMSIYV